MLYKKIISNGDILKSMHGDEVIWELDRRMPATVFFQEYEIKEDGKRYPPITEEAVRICLENSMFKAAYIDGYKNNNDYKRLSYESDIIFKSRPSDEIYLCAMTCENICLVSLNKAMNINKRPYHIFEDEIKQGIDPYLYSRYIQPAKIKVGEDGVKNIVNFYKNNRNAMGEKS